MAGLAPNIPANATLAVLIVDLEGLLCIEGSASGFSRSGCSILSHRVNELSEMVGLRVDGLEKMIKGRITAIEDGEAKILFDFSDDSKEQEKRKERRRPVHIPARVSDLAGRASIHCVISNASQNGCRLDGQGVGHLPDDIFLRINGLDLPVRGAIKWRGPGSVGVRLLWQFTSGKEMRPMLKGVGTDPNARPAKGADFGRTRSQSERAGQAASAKPAAVVQQEIIEDISPRELRRLERKARRPEAPAFQTRKKDH